MGDMTRKDFRHRVKTGRILLPDTEANLRPYKEPLLPVEGGFGFYGAIAQNKEKTHIQCHICGFFFPSVGAHANKIHGVDGKEYRETYQLSRTTSLASDTVQAVYRAATLNQAEATKEKRVALFKSMSREFRQQQQHGTKKSLERKNKEGRCPDQLIDKIVRLAEKIKRTPRKRDFIAEYGEGFWHSVYDTYGGWNNAVRIAGMQPSNVGGAHRVTYDYETVVDLVREFYRVEGRVPRATDIGKGIIPSKQVIRRLFGGVIEMRKAAGFELADYVHEKGDEYEREFGRKEVMA